MNLPTPRPARVLALLVTLIAAFPVGTAWGDEPKGDLARFQGVWTTKAGIDKDIDVRLEIKGNAAVAKVTTADGREFELKGEIALQEDAKPHKAIDWVKFKGPEGQDVADNPGIYTFQSDDEVTVCNGGPGNPRPTEFKPGDNGDPQVLALRRVKPDIPKAKPEAKDAPKGDLGKMQGSWSATVGPEMNIEIVLNIKGNDVELQMSRDGQERTVNGMIELDDAAKPHPSITFKGFNRPDGTEAPENLGIYAFEDADTLKVCTGGPGNDRPTELKGGEGGPPNLITLKRKSK